MKTAKVPVTDYYGYPPSKFEGLVEDLIAKRLQELVEDGVTFDVNSSAIISNRELCSRVYLIIHGVIEECLQICKLESTRECVGYIVQSYYSSMQINDAFYFDKSIIEQRITVEDVQTAELKKFGPLFRDADFGVDMINELKRRN